MVREICMIENFILPSLTDKKFGYLLEWVDVEMKIFKVFWSHKSRRQWTKALFAVFLEWDKIKGRTNLDEPEFFTKSKGRFRSALNRLSTCGKVLKLRSSIIGYRMYQITDIQEMNTPPHIPEVYVELPVYRVELDERLDLAGICSELTLYPDVNDEGKMSQLNHMQDDIAMSEESTNSCEDLPELPLPPDGNDEGEMIHYMQNDIVTSEESTNYYDGLPEDLRCSLDELNGDILIPSNIEEPLNGSNFPEDFNFSLPEDCEDLISQDFINHFITDASTLQNQ